MLSEETKKLELVARGGNKVEYQLFSSESHYYLFSRESWEWTRMLSNTRKRRRRWQRKNSFSLQLYPLFSNSSAHWEKFYDCKYFSYTLCIVWLPLSRQRHDASSTSTSFFFLCHSRRLSTRKNLHSHSNSLRRVDCTTSSSSLSWRRAERER